ncbi:MAG TPA: FecR family protein [Bryobacteraceae bacterium]|nr:FecR family protein [Bryobacteraceae bacterium]
MKDELRNLPLAKAPDSIWTSIEAALDAGVKPKRVWRPSVWVRGLAAAAALAIGMFTWYVTRAPKAAWAVVRVDGTPSVGSRRIERGQIEVGEWLQTDASSRARISVGDIGTVEVAPNTRVRMVASRPGEQRLRLARGEISASVSAPPRLFFVDTPASTAVDLGCAYTMKADGDGNGLLRVALGWVALEWAGRESLVPAGASCRTRSKIGPGTPYFDDASQGLQDALGSFDAGGGEAALDTVLAEARVRDTLTLWHLLMRVELAKRQRVYNRMVELVPLPKSVSAERALELDAGTLKLWREELAWKW